MMRFAEANAGHVNCWNVANAILYLMLVALYGLAYFEMLPWGTGTPAYILFEKYRTLMTADVRALRFFPFIIAYEGIFIFFQLVPLFRNNPLVQIITPWWVATSLIQVQWVREISTDDEGSLAYSMILIVAHLACLLGMILVIDARKPSFWEFWFLRAPFSLHAGFLIYCSAVNVNIWAASAGLSVFDESQLLCIANVSLAWVFVLTALFGVNTRRPDPLLILPVGYCVYYVWRNEGPLPALPNEMILSVEVACAHCWNGICCLGVMAVITRLYMVCVSNKVPKAYAEQGLMGAAVSVVDFDDINQ